MYVRYNTLHTEFTFLDSTRVHDLQYNNFTCRTPLHNFIYIYRIVIVPFTIYVAYEVYVVPPQGTPYSVYV